MILDGQQRLQSLVLALKGMAYGFQLRDHDWARSLQKPDRKETDHWSRACLCVNIKVLSELLLDCQGVIEWVDFTHVLEWVVLDPDQDKSSGRTSQQKTPLAEFQLGEPYIPLSKFWGKATVTHVRPKGKYDSALDALFSEFKLVEPGPFRNAAETLLYKLEELKATDPPAPEVQTNTQHCTVNL